MIIIISFIDTYHSSLIGSVLIFSKILIDCKKAIVSASNIQKSNKQIVVNMQNAFGSKKRDNLFNIIIAFGEFKVHYLIKLIAFWLSFFALFRLLFIIFHFAEIPSGQYLETGLTFFYGLRLDLSMACILIFFPFILWVLGQLLRGDLINKINRVFNYGMIVLVTILSVFNIKMYGEWGTLLSFRALKYMLYPKEAFSFISLGPALFLLITCVILSFFGIYFYKNFVTNFSAMEKNRKKMILESFFIPVIILIGSRGGIQLSPINESNSYFSNIQVNNLIATNNIWYLGHSIVDASDEKNPYLFLELAKAQLITKNLFEKRETISQNILKNKTPNIVFIILESWTADIIKSLGGEEHVTPHFEALSKEGLMFTQMYGSGFRTDQGLVSIFSGFPAQPNNSIITTPGKSQKLPSLSTELAKIGYQLSFYYGGEIEFANMKSYLLNSDFEKIIDKSDFPKNQLNSKWGAHDEHVLNKQLEDLKSEKQPFCSVVLTLSSHEPFEVPLSTPFNGTEEVEKFKKAAYYSDYCLFNYFEKAKKQPWYNNTLFILVADHGHRLPKNRNMNYPEGRRIAALITGGALVDSLKGTKKDKICNQNDLAATILGQMQISYSEFKWSKDVFNSETKDFAYYSNENVLGWITPEQSMIYVYATKTLSEPSKYPSDTTLLQAKAYLQTLYQQYLDY